MQHESQNPTDVPSLAVTFAYLKLLLGAFAIYAVLHYFWASKMLLSFHQLENRGLVPEGLGQVWFIFGWAFAVTVLALVVLDQRVVSSESRIAQIIKGWWLSLNAGFFEEIIYRGLNFLSAMIILPWLNFITFGLVKWFYVSVSIPIADWATFHDLHAQLVGHQNWVFGAAIISASVSFRDEHKYLGFFGWVNAWFIGMVMFYLVFHYGLLTAIAAHVLYDAVIFTLQGITSEERNSLSWARRTLRI